jgi:cytidylate kinase
VVVAVDGPSGSGKSTVAHQLADRLSVPHVDTGAYYRALTWAVLRHGVNTADAVACAELAQRVAITRASGRTYVNGEDVEDAIRGRDATAAVSVVSAHPAVRRLLVARQRAAVGQTGAVVEGRDAGTVVVPEADLKVWLTASPHLRAARRAAQLGEEDADVIAATADELARRDDADAQQMARAADAAIVDTTGRDVAEVVAELAGRALSAAGASP